MRVRSFLDTNVLVYTDDRDSPARQRRSLELVAECRRRRSGVVSVQVLQEYFVAATRKLGVDAPLARRKVQLFARLEVIVPRPDDVLAAIDLHRLHGLSFWDAMIVRAALAAGCRRLYSEDLEHGWRVDELEVVNPFGDSA